MFQMGLTPFLHPVLTPFLQPLLLPCPFTRLATQVTVDVPDQKGRLEILGVHARNKKLDGEVNLQVRWLVGLLRHAGWWVVAAASNQAPLWSRSCSAARHQPANCMSAARSCAVLMCRVLCAERRRWRCARLASLVLTWPTC
jgi:hypothetical protein